MDIKKMFLFNVGDKQEEKVGGKDKKYKSRENMRRKEKKKRES